MFLFVEERLGVSHADDLFMLLTNDDISGSPLGELLRVQSLRYINPHRKQITETEEKLFNKTGGGKCRQG